MTNAAASPTPSTPRPVWGGVAIAALTVAVMVTIAMSAPRSSTSDAGSIGMCIGTFVAIVFSWQRSSVRTFLVAGAMIAVFTARLQTPSQGTARLRPLTPADHATPTLDVRADGVWLVHPLGFEMRVPPDAELYEDEATLRAGRYSTLAAEMAPTSWVDESAQWDVDVVAARIAGVPAAERTRSFEDVVRSALAAMSTAGAHFERSQREGPRDEWVWHTIDGGSMATRFVMLDLPEGELLVTVHTRANVEASIEYIDSLHLR